MDNSNNNNLNMSSVGIVAEYNPFHNGHTYHISKARELSGNDCVIAVMSGNFVQRGEPAIIDKFKRATIALNSGVDLCLQLPTPISISSAESFAEGSIKILSRMGISSLSFGCEADDLDKLINIASLIVSSPAEYNESIKKQTASGTSYPLARHNAVIELLGPEYNEILNCPNNILAIEYLKAIKKDKLDIKPVPIKRIGDNYNDKSITSDTYASATAIRSALYSNQSMDTYLPIASIKELSKATAYIVPDDLSTFLEYELGNIFYRLKYNKNAVITELTKYIDITDAIAARIYNTFCDSNLRLESFTAFANEVKPKQYTLSRIKRCLLSVILNITTVNTTPEYIRILGFNQKGQQYLNQIKKTLDLPIINKAADHKSLLDDEIHATALYNQLQRMYDSNYNLNELTHGIIRV